MAKVSLFQLTNPTKLLVTEYRLTIDIAKKLHLKTLKTYLFFSASRVITRMVSGKMR
jgi:hypothetical protein